MRRVQAETREGEMRQESAASYSPPSVPICFFAKQRSRRCGLTKTIPHRTRTSQRRLKRYRSLLINAFIEVILNERFDFFRNLVLRRFFPAHDMAPTCCWTHCSSLPRILRICL